MKSRKPTTNMREKLLRELNDEVITRFEGNKAGAARAVQMHRVQFTNICNGKEEATIEKLVEIGRRLGWEIDLEIRRKKETKK